MSFFILHNLFQREALTQNKMATNLTFLNLEKMKKFLCANSLNSLISGGDEKEEEEEGTTLCQGQSKVKAVPLALAVHVIVLAQAQAHNAVAAC